LDATGFFCGRIMRGARSEKEPKQAGYGAIPTAYADAMSRFADAIARSIPEGGNPAATRRGRFPPGYR
jgi:hypothetical protein